MSPEEKRAEIVGVATEISRFSGPLPPPEALEMYNRILPGAADRILKMAEDQEKHRQDIERQVVRSNVFSQKAGLVMGFMVAITAIVGGIWLALVGSSAVGLTAIISALAALVGVFVYGKMRQGRELDEKARELPVGEENQQH